MSDKKNQQEFQWTNYWNQYFATFAVNLLVFAHGIAVGWLTPAIAILSNKNDTPLVSGPLTNEEISWIGAVMNIGSFVGTILLGLLISYLGSKRAILTIAIPEIVYWILIYFGTNYYSIFIARIFNGLGGGGNVTAVILFISEISDNKIRGRLGSSMMFTRSVGILCGTIFGVAIPYFLVPFISILFPILFFVIFFLLPNTPRFYLRKGQTQKAEDALKFYIGYKENQVGDEKAFHAEFETQKTIANDQKAAVKLQLDDFCNWDALKGIGIGIIFNTINLFSGSFVIMSYSAIIFQKTKTSIDPNISMIVLPVAGLFGCSLSTYLADKLGRKILNIISLAGPAIGLLIMSLYHYLNIHGCDLSYFLWIPIVSLTSAIFLSGIGIGSLVYVCSVEYIPSKIQNSAYTIVILIAQVVSFVFLKLFPILLEAIDLHGCLMILAGGSIFGVIFIAMLSETNGISLFDEEKKKEMTSICHI